MKKLIILSALAFGFTNLFSQHELSSFTSTGRGGATTFATDYQAIGINPANLGWQYKFDDKKGAMGYSEFTFSARSEALTKQEIRDMFTKDPTKFTYDEKVGAAKNFTDAGFALNLDYGSMGIAFYGEKFGGIGFRINDRIKTFMKLGEATSDILFLGKRASYFDQYLLDDGTTVDADSYDSATDTTINLGVASAPQLISQILKGTEINMSWIREYNLSYGRKLIDNERDLQLYVGAGVKYLQGLALLEIKEDDGDLTAYSSVTPFFDIDYGIAAIQNPSTVAQKGLLPNSVGSGFGFDLGANAILFEKLKIGAAITNIGSITWDGNVYTVEDSEVVDTEDAGLDNYNVFQGIQNIAGKDGVLQWAGEADKTVALPTVIRLGSSMEFGEKIELGVDIIAPGNKVPGNYESVVFGFGGDIQLIKVLTLSGGFVMGGGYATQIPLGITFASPTGGYEFGIASRDAVSFFKDKGATLSLSVGFLRFRF